MTERFSNLPIPVHTLEAKTARELFKYFPGLRRYFDTVVIPTEIEDLVDLPQQQRQCYCGKTLVNIIKYIVFTYDPESELVREYPDDLRLVKEAAAREAGFKREKDGEFPEYVRDFMELKDPTVLKWTVDYLKARKNKLWMEMRFLEEELEVLYRKRTEALADGKVDSKGMDEVKKRTDELTNLRKRFYAEHLDLKQATDDQLFPVTPENVFGELKIPDELWKVRQVKDVPKEARVH